MTKSNDVGGHSDKSTENQNPTIFLSETALEAAYKRIEETLVEFRDSRICFPTAPNGLVIKERDGKWSDLIRLDTRHALRIAIEEYLSHLSKE